MNNTIKRKMKQIHGFLNHMIKTKSIDEIMLIECTTGLEWVYDEMFADREDLEDTIDKPMS